MTGTKPINNNPKLTTPITAKTISSGTESTNGVNIVLFKGTTNETQAVESTKTNIALRVLHRDPDVKDEIDKLCKGIKNPKTQLESMTKSSEICSDILKYLEENNATITSKERKELTDIVNKLNNVCQRVTTPKVDIKKLDENLGIPPQEAKKQEDNLNDLLNGADDLLKNTDAFLKGLKKK